MGKIWTSYWGGHAKWPTDAIPIGITRYKPHFFYGINLESLAPSENLLWKWKNNQIDEYMFERLYFEELRERGFTPEGVKSILREAVGYRPIILCCYEKPDEFCHRHLLAKWLDDNIEEL